VYIPARFAHGFITLENATDVHYQISPEHAPGHGCTIRWDDPGLAITWPLQPMVISQNDRTASLFMRRND
jgi:dTDP-4-dehydrorhamnose 3,5-epimerase